MRGLSASAAAAGGFVPLTVTAHTPAGFASMDQWTPTIDGILSFAFVREIMGPDFGSNIDVLPCEGLPLAVTTVLPVLLKSDP